MLEAPDRPRGPLSGLLVADFSRILAGPYATMLLADLGADVIKVEGPSGDDTRTWMPPTHDDVSTYYLGVNRGKRSIALDLREEADAAVARELATRADVVIENFKVGGLAKFGLDYAGLSQANPRLVYCSVTGFGQDGPYAARAGYDFMIQGMAGFMDLTGPADGEPQKIGVALADIVTGLYGTIAIQAALATAGLLIDESGEIVGSVRNTDGQPGTVVVGRVRAIVAVG